MYSSIKGLLNLVFYGAAEDVQQRLVQPVSAVAVYDQVKAVKVHGRADGNQLRNACLLVAHLVTPHHVRSKATQLVHEQELAVKLGCCNSTSAAVQQASKAPMHVRMHCSLRAGAVTHCCKLAHMLKGSRAGLRADLIDQLHVLSAGLVHVCQLAPAVALLLMLLPLLLPLLLTRNISSSEPPRSDSSPYPLPDSGPLDQSQSNVICRSSR